MNDTIFTFSVVIFLTVLSYLIIYVYTPPEKIINRSNIIKILNYDGTLGLKFPNYDENTTTDNIQLVPIEESDNIIVIPNVEIISIVQDLCSYGTRGKLFIIGNMNSNTILQVNSNDVVNWSNKDFVQNKSLIVLQSTTDYTGKITNKVILRYWNDVNKIIVGSNTNSPEKQVVRPLSSLIEPINKNHLWTLKTY